MLLGPFQPPKPQAALKLPRAFIMTHDAQIQGAGVKHASIAERMWLRPPDMAGKDRGGVRQVLASLFKNSEQHE
jgi:hypothetical protein